MIFSIVKNTNTKKNERLLIYLNMKISNFKIFQFEKLELEETAREQSGNPARETKPEPELFKEEKPHQSSRSSKRQEPDVDPDDDVIKTDVTSGFAWNPAEVVARMYNIETIEDDHDEEQGDDSNLVIF